MKNHKGHTVKLAHAGEAQVALCDCGAWWPLPPLPASSCAAFAPMRAFDMAVGDFRRYTGHRYSREVFGRRPHGVTVVGGPNDGAQGTLGFDGSLWISRGECVTLSDETVVRHRHDLCPRIVAQARRRWVTQVAVQ